MIAKTVGTAIVGAGPYGLSIAAHLRARGIQHRIFGRPMVTWLNHMPKSMLLKSDGFASNLSAPAGDHTLRSYCLSHEISYDDYDIPVALTTFTDYALDFQRRFVPEVDERLLTELASGATANSHCGLKGVSACMRTVSCLRSEFLISIMSPKA